MSTNGHNPFLLPLAGILRNRGIRITFSCDMSQLHKELSITAPLLCQHKIDARRRMVVGIGNALLEWKERLRYRGIKLLMVSTEGLVESCTMIADRVCEHIYRVDVEDLREMITAGLPLHAVSAFTGLETRQIAQMVPRFYGKTVAELRDEGNV